MFNSHSYDLLVTTSNTYLKASAHFNNPSTLLVTFNFYTPISLAFLTRMLISYALIFSNTHSCLLFCHFFIKVLPFAKLTQHLDILFSSLISPSCLFPYFALCFLLDNTNMWSSTSSQHCLFTCLFYSLLPFTPAGKRTPISYCMFRLMADDFVAGMGMTHSSGYCMRPLTILKHFSSSCFFKS